MAYGTTIQGEAVKRAVVSASTQGDNSLVAAVPGKRIVVISGFFAASGGANTLTFESGTDTGEVTGALDIIDNGNLFLPEAVYGHFETAKGEALNLQLTAATAVGGWINYITVP